MKKISNYKNIIDKTEITWHNSIKEAGEAIKNAAPLFFNCFPASKSAIDQFLSLLRDITKKNLPVWLWKLLKKLYPVCSKTERKHYKPISVPVTNLSLINEVSVFNDAKNSIAVVQPTILIILKDRFKDSNSNFEFLFNFVNKILPCKVEKTIAFCGEKIKILFVGKGKKKFFTQTPENITFVDNPNLADYCVINSSKETKNIKQAKRLQIPLVKVDWLQELITSSQIPSYLNFIWFSSDSISKKQTKRKRIEQNPSNENQTNENPTIENENQIEASHIIAGLIEPRCLIVEYFAYLEKCSGVKFSEFYSTVAIRVKFYSDGQGVLASHKIPCAIFLLIPGYLIGKPEIILKSKPLIFLNFDGNEKEEFIERILITKGYFIGKLLAKPIQFGCLTINIEADGMLGDNLQLQNDSGCNKGNSRCICCSINFSKDEIIKSMDYSIYSPIVKAQNKGLFENFKLFFCTKMTKEQIEEEAAKLGISKPPLLIQTIAAVIMEENKCTLKEVLPKIEALYKTIDNLHNNCGSIKRFIKQLIKFKKLDVNTFNFLLKKELKTDSLAKCDGKKTKLLTLAYHKIVIPSLLQKQELKENVEQFFELMKNISWVSYQEDEILDPEYYEGIVAWLHYLCFRLGEVILAMPKELKLICLYLHNVVCEYPVFLRNKKSLGSNSCENGEEMLARLKKIFLYFTSRKKEESILTVLKRTQFEMNLSTVSPKKHRIDYLISKKRKPKKEFIEFLKLLEKQQDIILNISSPLTREGKAEELFANNVSNWFPNVCKKENSILKIQISSFLKKYLEKKKKFF